MDTEGKLTALAEYYGQHFSLSVPDRIILRDGIKQICSDLKRIPDNDQVYRMLLGFGIKQVIPELEDIIPCDIRMNELSAAACEERGDHKRSLEYTKINNTLKRGLFLGHMRERDGD